MKNILTCFLIFILISIFTQTQQSIKDMFWNAETSFYEKNYKEALMLYHNIYNNDNQNNANVNYRIGICYLKGYNKNSEKIKAVPYLEKAVNSTTKTYKEGDINLTSAHEDAFIYLGDVYLIKNELDNAINAYNDYKNISQMQDKYYLNIVNRKIETCYSAKILENLSSLISALVDILHKIARFFLNPISVPSGVSIGQNLP
jgi:tetratricopeptide (TPR) repeat protein